MREGQSNSRRLSCFCKFRCCEVCRVTVLFKEGLSSTNVRGARPAALGMTSTTLLTGTLIVLTNARAVAATQSAYASPSRVRMLADGEASTPSARRILPPPAMLPRALQRHWRRRLGCEECEETRAVCCPRCDGIGGYTAMGNVDVACKACAGTGRVICRACFVGDGYDIAQIRRDMGVPD